MKEDYVSFELAKKLKEKGFDWKTRCGYLPPMPFLHEAFNDTDWSAKNGYAAPVISQVLKWLRETKNIEVVASFSYRSKEWGYQVGDMALSEDSILAYDYSFPTYEQAIIEGIKYAIDNLL